ncbi:hypothetical protein RB200_27805 [Streptomyces sp. PmtG]
MRPRRLLLPALLLIPLALTGCGADDKSAEKPPEKSQEKSQEKKGAGTRAAAPPQSPEAAASPQRSEAAAPPKRSELVARALAAQTRVEHVYLTKVPGYRAAQQSAGVLGDDGFQVTYVKGTAQIALRVERGTVDDGNCRTVQPAASDCAKDGRGWYRVTGSRHEYALTERGLRVQVAADRAAVDRATLRAAAAHVHRADARELDAILPAPTGREKRGGPVERGDLPAHGDGAPQDPPGAGG